MLNSVVSFMLNICGQRDIPVPRFIKKT